jgi:hypothetical protein
LIIPDQATKQILKESNSSKSGKFLPNKLQHSLMNQRRGGGSVIEHVLGICVALTSILSTKIKEEEKKKKAYNVYLPCPELNTKLQNIQTSRKMRLRSK